MEILAAHENKVLRMEDDGSICIADYSKVGRDTNPDKWIDIVKVDLRLQFVRFIISQRGEVAALKILWDKYSI